MNYQKKVINEPHSNATVKSKYKYSNIPTRQPQNPARSRLDAYRNKLYKLRVSIAPVEQKIKFCSLTVHRFTVCKLIISNEINV